MWTKTRESDSKPSETLDGFCPLPLVRAAAKEPVSPGDSVAKAGDIQVVVYSFASGYSGQEIRFLPVENRLCRSAYSETDPTTLEKSELQASAVTELLGLLNEVRRIDSISCPPNQSDLRNPVITIFYRDGTQNTYQSGTCENDGGILVDHAATNKFISKVLEYLARS